MAFIEPVEFVSKSGKKILIRSAKKEEASQILEAMIFFADNSPYILRTGDDFRKMSLSEQEKYLETLLNREASFFLVVKHDDKVIGTSDFLKYKDSKRGHRGGLGITIHPSYRGDGIGEAVMKTVIESAKKFPTLKFVELEVMGINQPAFKLYQKLGFKVLHRTPQAYQLSDGTFTENILMRLENKK